MEIKKIAELVLIRSVPASLLKKTNRGRLQNKCLKLIDLVDKEVRGANFIPTKDFDKVDEIIVKFGELTGWEGKEKHVITVISFLFRMIEESNFSYPQKITDYLAEIYEYFERKHGDKKLMPCFVGGNIAMDKWEKITNEYQIVA